MRENCNLILKKIVHFSKNIVTFFIPNNPCKIRKVDVEAGYYILVRSHIILKKNESPIVLSLIS